MFCVDASVIVNSLNSKEPHFARSQEFLNYVNKEKLKVFLPETALIEVASALFRATKDKKLTAETIKTIEQLPNFSFVSIDSALRNNSIEVIKMTGLKSADAIYIALAVEYGLTLITLDKEQLLRGEKLIITKAP